jgi:hypothetical protein
VTSCILDGVIPRAKSRLVAVGAAALLLSAAHGASARGTSKPRPEQTAPPPADLDTAERQYAELDYEEANHTAERFLQQRGLTHDQLVRGYRILALTSAILDHGDDAREAFELLLTYSPDFQADPNLGPKVTTPFFEARGFWRGQRSKPGLEVVTTAHATESAVLRVTTRDPTHLVQALILGYRWGPSSAYTSKPVAVGEAVQVETTPAPEGATRIDYYVQALDRRDNVVFEAGNPTSPKSVVLEAPPAPPPPLHEKHGGSVLTSPIFWGVVVAVVAAGGVGAYFLARPKDPTSASLGSGVACGGMVCQ